jgi:hypothetical protein
MSVLDDRPDLLVASQNETTELAEAAMNVRQRLLSRTVHWRLSLL